MRACGRLARLEAKRQDTREFSSQTTQLHFQRAFTLPLFHYTPVQSAVKVPGSVPSTVGDTKLSGTVSALKERTYGAVMSRQATIEDDPRGTQRMFQMISV